jgi:hypothetical protein
MNERSFLLSLGNQKCGTTWLHRYLRAKPNFNGGALKEYHTWDALDVPLQKHWVVTSEEELTEYTEICFKMQQIEDYYFDYFQSLYSDQINLCGDITPSYSGLDAPRLNYIKTKFAERDITVKAVILIREPVSRIKSAVRYNLDRSYYKEGIVPGTTDFSIALSQYYLSAHCRMRTCYHDTITKAWDVFGKANVHVGIYETMFTLPEIESLSEFCGVSVTTELANKRINKTQNEVETIPSLESEIRNAYHDVYKYCYEQFPVIKSLWA